MSQKLFTYFAFTTVLISAILLFPNFFLAQTMAVFLAVLFNINSIHRLSVFILGFIVAAVTIAWPMFLLFVIGNNSGLSPLDYLNAKNMLGFALPTCVVIVLAFAAQRYFPKGKER